LVESLRVHDDDGGLGGTGTTDEERVAETPLLTLGVVLIRKGSDFLEDILSTSRISGGNEQWREQKTARRSPGSSLPECPGLGLWVNKVVEDGFLVEVGSVGRDLRKRSVSLLKDLTVEALTVLSLEETTESPGQTVDEIVLNIFLLKSLNTEELSEGSLQK
jgi:hypothetical protein